MSLVHQLVETIEVEFVRRDAEQIAGWAAEQAVVADESSETEDVCIERVLGARRRLGFPQRIDEPVA